MKKLNGDSLTPILIFRRLQGKQKFLLESSSLHEGSGRYSFIGMDPVKSYRGSGRSSLRNSIYTTGKTYMHEGDLYVLLKTIYATNYGMMWTFRLRAARLGMSVTGLRRMSEGGPDDDLGLPDVYFNIYETIIIYRSRVT